MDETQSQELVLTGPAGFGARVKGPRLMGLISLLILAAALAWGAVELRAHAGDAQKQGEAIVKSVTDANTAIVQSLKESNSATVKAIESLTSEQRKANATMREIACLSDPAMKNRNDAREFCRRMAGGPDRYP